MSLRAIWVFGLSIFCVLMMVTLGGFAGAAEVAGPQALVKIDTNGTVSTDHDIGADTLISRHISHGIVD